MKRLKNHPASSIFPMMGDVDYANHLESIRENGQQVPIDLLGGMILDGRNRYKAVVELGRDPITRDLPEDTDPVDYVMIRNLFRRQLRPSQHAMILAKYSLSGDNDSTVKVLAERYNAKENLIIQARSVVNFGNTALEEMIDRGELAVTPAADFVRHSKLTKEQKSRAISAGVEAVITAKKEADKEALKSARPGSAKEREAGLSATPDKPARRAKTKRDSEVATPTEAAEDSVVDAMGGSIDWPVVGEPWDPNFVAGDDSPVDPGPDDDPDSGDEIDAEFEVWVDDATMVEEESDDTEVGPDPDPASPVVAVTVDNLSVAIACVDRMTFPEKCLLKSYLNEAMRPKPAAGELLPFDPKAIAMKGKLDCPEFRSTWERWCDYQSEMFDRLSEDEAERQIDVLKHKQITTAIACLEVAMDAGDKEMASKVKAQNGASFVPPTKAQVAAYVAEKELKVDAGKFVGYYEAQGWRLANGNKMAKWRAAVRNWHDSGGSKAVEGRYANDPAKYDPNRRNDPENGKL